MEQESKISSTLSQNRDTSLQTVLEPIGRLLRADVFILLLIFAVFHYFKLSHFLISIDDEFEAFRANGYNWILTGRWAAYLFLKFLIPQPILPFFPTLLFGLGLCLSYPLLLSCFGVRRLGPVHYLAFPLYAGFPTWIYMTSFTTMSVWSGVAQLIVVVALDRYRKIIDSLGSGSAYDRSTITANILLSVLALAVALGFYQTFRFPSLFWAWACC